MIAKPTRLDVYRTAIPMRSFEHAAASRELAEAIAVRLELSDGSVGWGETLPRDYVTGETLQSVPQDLERTIWPACAGTSFDREESLSQIPSSDAAGRCINATRCAFELAVMDATSAGGREAISSRVSGVLGSADPARTSRRLRFMRLMGLRDFKLKLGMGDDVDAENLRLVHRRLGKALAAGRCTLRVDVNGAWSASAAPDRVAELKRYGVCAVEQPTRCRAEEFVELARKCELPLLADESLVTRADAETLLAEPRRVWWNIRISKNGGLSPATAMARLATRHGVTVVVGCMVGESSILSAAQRRLLQCVPPPRFVEGNYGRFLLADDLTRKSLRFGYGGRLKPLRGRGLGVNVSQDKVEKYGVKAARLQN